MIISAGILAHNEENRIANLLHDIGSQTLLTNPDMSVAIHVVANGCVDATTSIAEGALASPSFQRDNVKTFVHAISMAGKSNAWNELVHDCADPETDLLFLLDADIRIPRATTLQLVVDHLMKSKIACVAIDDSVKDLSLEGCKTMRERLILAASRTTHDIRNAIAGGFYCARFEALKGIWMPIGLPVEDGFLRAMILTSNLTEEENLERISFVEGAFHVFESLRSFRALFHHHIRHAIGLGINALLFQYFRGKIGGGDGIGDLIRERNAEDPNWLNGLIVDEVERGNYFLIPKTLVFRRLEWLSGLDFPRRVRKAPIVLMGVLFDLLVFLRASYLIRRGVGAGFW